MTAQFIPILKTDDELRLIYTVVYKAEKVDAHGDKMSRKALREACHKFMQKSGFSQQVDTNHDNVANGCAIVEMGIARPGDPIFNDGDWWAVFKIYDDDIWEKIQSGELNGVSFDAMAKIKPKMVKNVYSPIGFGRTQMENDHDHYFFVKLDSRGKVISGMTSFDDGHRHKIFKTIRTEKEMDHAHRLEVDKK